MNSSGNNPSHPPTFILPKNRTSSQNDNSYNVDSTTFNSTRTVSSSSSMVSTPSNNIRRLRQKQQQQQDQQKNQTGPKINKSQKSSNGRLIKSKLLNLQQSLKRFINGFHNSNVEEDAKLDDMIDVDHPNKSVPSFIIHKPVNMNSYDYSIFTNYPNGIDLQHGDHLPPAIKETQIKAWESAEKISKNVIFGNSSDSDEDDNHKLISYNNPVTAIPGYTKGEFGIVSDVYQRTQRELGDLASEEKYQLFNFKKKAQSVHERAYSQAHAFSTRRQVQITQKKELLHRMFGYSNNLNLEYITNNSSYSAFDNSSNIQKTFYEDKEEIAALQEEDKAYMLALEEARHNFGRSQNYDLGINIKRKRRRSEESDPDNFDYEKFQSLVANKLDKLYNNYFVDYDGDILSHYEDNDEEDEVDNLYDGELHHLSLSYLRKCIKEEVDYNPTSNDNEIS